MATRVRDLEPPERDELRMLLGEIHSHTDDCRQCQDAIDGRGMCTTGIALYSQWSRWLTRVGEGAEGDA